VAWLPPQYYGELERRAREETEAVTGKPGRHYRIRRGEQVVEACSRPTGSGWAFETQDQPFAQAIIDEIEEACRFFWQQPAPDYYGCPEIEGISDEDVDTRIAAFDSGENTREARRTMKKQFDLVDLPRDRKRALIERIERLKRQYEFAWIEEPALAVA
jgi:hypothetical protein